MIIKKMFKVLILSIFINLLASINVLANSDFNLWVEEFKIKAKNIPVILHNSLTNNLIK